MASKKSLDFRRDIIEPPIVADDVETPRFKEPFDWKNASITVLLFIIALWSAYVITQLLSGHSISFFDRFKKTTEQPATTKVEEPNKTSDTPKTAEQPAAASTNDPFAPLTKDDASKIEQKTDTTASKEIAKDSFTIRILNGNGIDGDGAKMKAELTKKGFKVGTVGNAKTKYTTTQIYYIASKSKEAQLVADNSGKKTELHEAEQSFVGSGYQVLVVIGKQ